jgi:hypothetical protein
MYVMGMYLVLKTEFSHIHLVSISSLDFYSATLHRCFLPSLAPFGQAVSEEKIILTLANQKKELILAAMFAGRMEPNVAITWHPSSVR